MSLKKWSVAPCDKAAATELAEACGADPFLTLIAMGRGICSPEELEEFLSDDVVLPDTASFAGMANAVERIRRATEGGERITVFGDYDCDGVTATAILCRYLSKKGADVHYYIPDREGEGYGMSEQAVRDIAEDGTSLIITVDNGIKSVAEVELASSLGVDTVITDHHLPGGELPKAAAVVDPHAGNCPSGETGLSGAGLALVLVAAVEGVTVEEMLEEYSALAAIGTVADVVPLTGSNRVIVREGLRNINLGAETCVSALLRAAGAKGEIKAETLSYAVAPRINAAGRMGSADMAIKLFLSDNESDMEWIADKLCGFNNDRRACEQKILGEAVGMIEQSDLRFDRVLVVTGKGWHCGVIGIVASALVERYGKPAVVLSENDGVLKGSARSVEGFNIAEAIGRCGELTTRFGGHSGAAGLTLPAENGAEFRRLINAIAAEGDMPVPELKIDCKLNLAAISVHIADRLSGLEPFGAGNPVPMFGLFGVKIDRVEFVGDKKHTRLIVSKNNAVVSAMLFSVGEDSFPYAAGDSVDLAVGLSLSFFKEVPSVTVTVRGIRPAGADAEELLSGIRLYEAVRRGEEYGVSGEAAPPDRNEIGEIWKTIKARPGVSEEYLLYTSPLPAFKTAAATDVLLELGLITQSGSRLNINPGVKADLADSRILRAMEMIK